VIVTKQRNLQMQTIRIVNARYGNQYSMLASVYFKSGDKIYFARFIANHNNRAVQSFDMRTRQTEYSQIRNKHKG